MPSRLFPSPSCVDDVFRRVQPALAVVVAPQKGASPATTRHSLPQPRPSPLRNNFFFPLSLLWLALALPNRCHFCDTRPFGLCSGNAGEGKTSTWRLSLPPALPVCVLRQWHCRRPRTNIPGNKKGEAVDLLMVMTFCPPFCLPLESATANSFNISSSSNSQLWYDC